MPKFEIIEFDRDYHTVTDCAVMEFPTREAAKKWCRENSWAGYEYFVSMRRGEPEVNGNAGEAV